MSCSSDDEYLPLSQREWLRMHLDRKEKVRRILFESNAKVPTEVNGCTQNGKNLFSKSLGSVKDTNNPNIILHVFGMPLLSTAQTEEADEVSVMSESAHLEMIKEEEKKHEKALEFVRNLRKEDISYVNILPSTENVNIELTDETDRDDNSVQQFVEDEMAIADEYALSLEFNKFCPKCLKSPCVWYGHNYVFVANTHAAENPSGGHDFMPPSEVWRYQSEQRKVLYRKLHRVRTCGIIGTNRIEFPDCVMDEVCALYPSPTGHYLGFRKY